MLIPPSFGRTVTFREESDSALLDYARTHNSSAGLGYSNSLNSHEEIAKLWYEIDRIKEVIAQKLDTIV
jgi:hypothetical protein